MFRYLCLSLLCLLGTSATAEVRVLTSIKPLQLIAAAIQDGVGSPDVLLPPGASPHAYALRPSDVRRLTEADLLYWIGPDMENFLPRMLGRRDRPSVAVQDLPEMHLRRFDALHANEHGHDHDHRPGSLDAHLWLLPANARAIATRMTSDLVASDPANGERYKANLSAFSQRLDTLDQRLAKRLAPLAGKPFFVFHEAFDYFEAAYGLKHAGVFSVVQEVQPGARHVSAMRLQLQQAGPSCVFYEPPLLPRLAETLTSGLPARLAMLDALGSGLAVDAYAYEALLGNLADGLGGCLESL